VATLGVPRVEQLLPPIAVDPIPGSRFDRIRNKKKSVSDPILAVRLGTERVCSLARAWRSFPAQRLAIDFPRCPRTLRRGPAQLCVARSPCSDRPSARTRPAPVSLRSCLGILPAPGSDHTIELARQPRACASDLPLGRPISTARAQIRSLQAWASRDSAKLAPPRRVSAL
jgi:hypothetical protein